MIVQIVKVDGIVCGYTMKGENKDEIKKLGAIRDLQFFGMDETSLVYKGRSEGNDKTNDPGILEWRQKRFTILPSQQHPHDKWVVINKDLNSRTKYISKL